LRANELGDIPIGRLNAALFAAANDVSDRLRFPAGPDSEALANARWNSTDEQFLTGMRSVMRMKR
jgi:hypothetical protein